MTTANPLREDNYEWELSRVRGKIKTKFVELIDCLKAKESELLRELDNILTSYLSYRSELEKVNENKQEFKIKRNALEGVSIISAKSKQEDILKQLSTKLKSIETP